MDTDRNLLFGVLALQGDLIDSNQFAEACTAWSVRKDRPLASILTERGWMGPGDVSLVEQLLERKLKKHSGDVRKSLADAAASGSQLHATIASAGDELSDRDVRATLSGLPRAASDTIQYIAPLPRTSEQRDRYTLTTLHARGGIGQVWLARDAELDREVA